MSRNYFLFSACVILSFAGFIAAQSTNRNVSRCFQFTWLGPRWDNESIFLNASCQDATKLAKSVPCSEPLVVSFDGSWPSIEYIWANHLENASCILADNDVCAQHTYYFNGKVDNSTYLCTRAVDDHGKAITSGCYEQRNGSFVTRSCFCRSTPGGVPCNNAGLTTINLVLIIGVLAALISNNDLFPWR